MKFHKILIVDDDIDTLNLIVNCFDDIRNHYLFYRATNVRDALQIYADYAIDLIITDWEMPGVNGIELIKYVKNNIPDHATPMIMLTGKMTCPQHLDIAFTAGATDFIRKPIEKIELIARIRSMLLLADSHRETIELKNRDLVNAALHIVQNNEFNAKLRQKVLDMEKKCSHLDVNLTKMLKGLNEDLCEKIKAEAWDKFDAYFKQVHPNFFNSLIDICPTISPAELRLAAFLKLSVGTKEIAAIMFLTVDSVRTARTRLRKRLKIRQDVNLMTFLLSI
jgi:DNA-binding response OmpR family regulator/DNA-binding CsgD family transcriptional regulator